MCDHVITDRTSLRDVTLPSWETPISPYERMGCFPVAKSPLEKTDSQLAEGES